MGFSVNDNASKYLPGKSYNILYVLLSLAKMAIDSNESVALFMLSPISVSIVAMVAVSACIVAVSLR